MNTTVHLVCPSCGVQEAHERNIANRYRCRICEQVLAEARTELEKKAIRCPRCKRKSPVANWRLHRGSCPQCTVSSIDPRVLRRDPAEREAYKL